MWKIKEQPSLAVYGSNGGYICIQSGDYAKDSNEFAVIAIHPKALAQVIERMQYAAEQLREPDVSGIKLSLPHDLKVALYETRPRKIRVEDPIHSFLPKITISLKPLRSLKVEIVEVRPQFGDLPDQDPHRNERGWYTVPVVRLVQGAAANSLMWLPTVKRYCTFDCEHSTIMVFRPKLTWAELRADIDRHYAIVNDGGSRLDPEFVEEFAPWPSVPFVAVD